MKRMQWKQVQDTFSESQRNYNGKYLLIDYVLDNKYEISYFTGEQDEIFYNFNGIRFGVIYVDRDKAPNIIELIKWDIEKEISKNGKLSNQFIEKFKRKYNVQKPKDTLFAIDEKVLYKKIEEIFNF